MQTSPTSVVPRAPSSARDDAVESLMVHMAERALLLLVGPTMDVAGLRRALADAGLMVIKVGTADEAELVACLPRFALVDTSVPGALELLSRLTSESEGVLAIAVLPPNGSASEAVQAGACATLHAPLVPSDVVTTFQRLRGIRERYAQSLEHTSRAEASASAATAARVASGILARIAEPLGDARDSLEALSTALREGSTRSGEEVQAFLRGLDAALRTVEELAERMRGLGASKRPPLDRISLSDAAHAAVESMRSVAYVPIALDATAQVVAKANRASVVAVVRLLVESAVQAVDGAADPWVLVRVYETVSESRISVRDNGPTIPMHAREHVFEPFFAAAGRGRSGLSLSLAYWLVANMDGVLTVSREPGPGACFRVRLPRA